MREIALDTETTGLDPASGHRIVEIGCVEMVNRIRTGEVFHVYLNPERAMPEEAFKVHGLSDAFLRDKPLFSQIVEEFLTFLGDAPLVIHNAGFDMKFLNHELARVNQAPISFDKAIDTVQIARKKFPGSPANLDALCRRFAIDLSQRTKHGALLDAELLSDVYLELMGGRQSKLVLQSDKAASQLTVDDAPKVKRERRHFAVSEAELLAHQNFITTLPNALWLKQDA